MKAWANGHVQLVAIYGQGRKPDRIWKNFRRNPDRLPAKTKDDNIGEKSAHDRPDRRQGSHQMQRSTSHWPAMPTSVRRGSWRRERDSNPRWVLATHAFQACALNHSAISPPINRNLNKSATRRNDFQRVRAHLDTATTGEASSALPLN